MIAEINGADVEAILSVLAGALGALGLFTWTIFRIARGVAQINRAVNHQGPDEPPLVEIVKGLRDMMAVHDEGLRDMMAVHDEGLRDMMAVHDERATDTRNKVAALELLATSRHKETSEALVTLSHGQDEIRKGLSRLQGRVSKVETAKKAGAR